MTEDDKDELIKISERAKVWHCYENPEIKSLVEKIYKIMRLEEGKDYETEIRDFEDQNIIQYFGECLKFMKGEEKILVHCRAGASRSATIVIAYLMWTKKMEYGKALQFVKDKRFIVFPNDGFREQLKMFEKLLKENDYDIEKINFKEIKWSFVEI